MRKFPKSIIAKILIICASVLIISAPFYKNLLSFLEKKGFKGENDSKQFSQLIAPLTLELQKRWRLGDLEQAYQSKGFSCPGLIENNQNLTGEYFKCNFLYLECFLEGKASNQTYFSIKSRMGEYEFIPVKNNGEKFLSITSSGNVLLALKLKGTDLKLNFELKDSCRSNYLPQKNYSAGNLKGKSKTFDTFGQKIFIDKTYFSYKDKYQIEMAKKKISFKEINPKLAPYPYTEVSLEKRNSLCHARGGKLLKSHLLDAASFFPTENKEDSYFYKYPYHWQKGRRGSFLDESKTNSRFGLKKEDCDKAYVLGCEKLTEFIPDSSQSLSYMGMHFPLGGFLESVENEFDPKKNLKVSSFYFPPYSNVHEVGMRAFWSGEGFEREDFDLESLEESFSTLSPYQVAFRCFYEGEIK